VKIFVQGMDCGFAWGIKTHKGRNEGYEREIPYVSQFWNWLLCSSIICMLCAITWVLCFRCR